MKQQTAYLFLVIMITILWGCSSGSDEPETPLSEEEQESVEVLPEVIFATADDQPLHSYIQSRGVVEANRQTVLTPRISGYVEQSGIVSGRRVSKGDTLLTFGDEEFRYDLQEARNNYKQAMSEYRIEAGSQGSGGILGEEGTNGQNTIRDDSLVRIFSGLASAELNMKRARLEFSHTVLTAPFSGTLHTTDRVPAGSYLGAGTELGQLVDDRTVRVRFEVLEAELNRVREGMAALLTTPGGEQMTGQVVAVSPVVDTESKTGQVVAEVANPNGYLKPGMTVEGRIRTQSVQGDVRIPRSAILERDGGRTLLFRLNPSNNEVEWVYVNVEAQNDQWAIVNATRPGANPVEPGDTLAIGRHLTLSHLQKVQPRMELLEREEAPAEGDVE